MQYYEIFIDNMYVKHLNLVTKCPIFLDLTIHTLNIVSLADVRAFSLAVVGYHSAVQNVRKKQTTVCPISFLSVLIIKVILLNYVY